MIKYARYGGYECSTQGDRRFSAFYAILPDGNSIEWHYQCSVKGYSSIKEGKGKPPLYPCDTQQAYINLWIEWAKNNQDLMYELFRLVGPDGTLSDKFAKTPINQARTLAYLLNNPSLWKI